MKKECDDLDLSHKKIDLKQFSEMQTTIIKEQLKDHLNAEVDKQKRSIDKRNILLWTIITLIIGGNVIGWFKLLTTTKKQVEKALTTEVSNIRDSINVRLNREFEAPIITKLIENKAQEYTERNSKIYIETQVKEKIKPYESAVQERLNTADDRLEQTQLLIKQSEDQLISITEQNDIFALQADAISGDRRAFDKLISKQYRNKQNLKTAENTYKSIIRSYFMYQELPTMYQDVYLNTPDGKKVEIKELSASAIYKQIETPFTQVDYRRAMMLYITQKPKKEILESSLYILQNSKSLDACAAACGVLKNVLNRNDVGFMDFNAWIKVINSELKK